MWIMDKWREIKERTSLDACLYVAYGIDDFHFFKTKEEKTRDSLSNIIRKLGLTQTHIEWKWIIPKVAHKVSTILTIPNRIIFSSRFRVLLRSHSVASFSFLALSLSLPFSNSISFYVSLPFSLCKRPKIHVWSAYHMNRAASTNKKLTLFVRTKNFEHNMLLDGIRSVNMIVQMVQAKRGRFYQMQIHKCTLSFLLHFILILLVIRLVLFDFATHRTRMTWLRCVFPCHKYHFLRLLLRMDVTHREKEKTDSIQ